MFYILPLLMLVVVAGTVAQRYVGLYVAEQSIFAAPLIWIYGLVPLPGGWLLLAVLTFSLTLKFLLKSEWSLARTGIILTHGGALLLLVGGLVTSLTSQEGYITIPEGGTVQSLRDYHTREVMLVRDGNILSTIPAKILAPRVRLSLGNLPFSIEVISVCNNCQILRRAQEDPRFKGMARGMKIEDQPLMKEDEANVGGMTFRLKGTEADDGTHILFEDGPTTKFAAGGQEYELVYSKQQRPLPFSLRLVDFVKETYPGTDTAKAYYSDVVVKDGELEWPARIEMNQPLRYKGYTFYQSSFADLGDSEASVLAVAENNGRIFPYIATAIMGLGLLLHLFQTVRQRRLP